MNRIISIIPAYCPTYSLINTIDSLVKNDIDIVVVDDGSGKKYEWLFNSIKNKVTLLRHEINKGKGAALKTAMQYIDNNFDDYVIVCVDADGQHLVKDVINCSRNVNDNELVLGVRRFDRSKVPFKSYYGNKITEVIFKLFTGVYVSDTQTGLRAFNKSLVKEFLKVDSERYEYEMNQLLYCAKEKIDIKEIEIETVYENNNQSSHFHPFRDSFLIYKQILQFGLSSISSFIIDYLLFSLFSILLKGNNSLIYANILARIGSGLFNYEINKRIVFKDNNNHLNSLSKYILLASLILLLNTTILYLLSNILNINLYISKIITEATMFLFSWFIQKHYVFLNKGVKKYEKENVL